MGIEAPKKVPTLYDFGPRFKDEIRIHCAGKPRTIAFWEQKLMRLLEFPPLSSAPLDKIDKSLIASYVQKRHGKVAVATIDRELATLSRILYLAHDWNEIAAVPRIKLLKGERNRDFVFSQQQEKTYLEAAPEPLTDIAIMLLETGLRLGEALALKWADIELDAANGKKLGYLLFAKGSRRTQGDT